MSLMIVLGDRRHRSKFILSNGNKYCYHKCLSVCTMYTVLTIRVGEHLVVNIITSELSNMERKVGGTKCL